MPIRKLHRLIRHQHQRGVGTLAVTVLLLLGASIVLLYLNRNVIFEQRISTNQMRAASAHEISEAGLEWAIGMFNHSQKIDASCSDSNLTSDLSFRSRYIRFPVHPVSGLPVTASTVDKPMYPDVLPGCSINAVDGGLSCSCPDSGTATLDLGAGASHFTVRFEPEKDDVDISDSTKFHWETVRITSIGCVAATGACTPSGEKAVANTANADATALTSVAVKLRPAIRRKPLAPLICGGDCELSSGFKIINTSATAGGLLIIAGGKIDEYDEENLQTIPGIPLKSAIIEDDPSLSLLTKNDGACDNEAIFQSYFGSSIDQYGHAPTTRIIECGQCETNVQEAYAEGARTFFFPNGLHLENFSGSELGTTAEPVILVTPSHFRIDANITVHGVIFSNSMETNTMESGPLNIHGAIVTCAKFKGNGNGTLRYSDEVMANVSRHNSQLARVPGSWRDWGSP